MHKLQTTPVCLVDKGAAPFELLRTKSEILANTKPGVTDSQPLRTEAKHPRKLHTYHRLDNCDPRKLHIYHRLDNCDTLRHCEHQLKLKKLLRD